MGKDDEEVLKILESLIRKVVRQELERTRLPVRKWEVDLPTCAEGASVD